MSNDWNLRTATFGGLSVASLNEERFGADQAKALRRERLAAVLSLTPGLMLTNAAIGGLCTFVFFGRGLDLLLIAWLTTLCMIAGYGLVTVLGRDRSRPPSGSTHARNVLTGHAALLATLWSVPPLLLMPHAQGYEGYILTGVMAGIMAGGPFALAPVPRAAFVWLAICTIANVAAFVANGHPVMISLALATMIWAALIAYNVLRLAVSESERFGQAAAAAAQADALSEQRDMIDLLLREYETDGGSWRWRTDQYGVLLRAPDELMQLLGLTDEDVVGVDCFKQVVSLRLPDSENNVRSLRARVAARDRFTDVLISVLDRRNVGGEKRWISLSGKPQWREDGEFDGYRGIAADVTAHYEAERRIQELATRDALTGLWNRTSFNERVESLLRMRTPFVVALIDLDRFKACNDRLGHQAGDELLQRIARILETHASNVLGYSAMAVRIGGDEFAVLAPGPNPVECNRRMEAFAERVIRDVGEPHALDAGIATVGASIGLATFPTDANNAETLSKRADLALYRAKDEGRGRWCAYDAAMDRRERERGRMEQALREAVEQGGFTLAYQPIVTMTSDKTSAMEALLRWNHPEFGNVSPATFIPIIEEMGLMNTLGEWVLFEACQEAATWSDAQTITVNVSSAQLCAPHFVCGVRAALESAELDPSRLEIEITEGGLLDDFDRALETLQTLREIGVSIALDDFGRGYASLSYLREFKFDRIKIDRSFISALVSEGDGAGAIVRSIVDLAHELGISTTASGVERDGQIEVLRNLGCHEVQGFLLGAPSNADAALRRDEKRTPPKVRDIRVSGRRARTAATAA